MAKLGYGTWGLGGLDYGPITEEKALGLLKHALKKNINFFDTAPLYGNGRAEKIIGKLFNTHDRKKIIISTKAGMLPHKGFDWKQDFSVSNILEDLDNSLHRLNTSYIDIYLLHNPDLKLVDISKIIELSKKLKKLNLIKRFGISLRSPLDFNSIKKLEGIDALEFNFNLLDQRALDIKLLEKLFKNNIFSICRTPLCFGFLTDKKLKKKNMSKNDHRKNYPIEQFRRWEEGMNYFRNFLKKDNYLKFALNFCLSHKFQYVIPGMMSTNDIDSNLIISKSKKISNLELNNIYKQYKSFDKNFFITNKKKYQKKLIKNEL